MSYYIYKLNFTAPVHFGDTVQGVGLEKVMLSCFADTFFSAFYNEAIYLKGEEETKKWLQLANQNQMLISDLLPYQEDNFYLPRPFLNAQKNISIEKEKFKIEDRKEIKKIKFIAVNKFEEYLRITKEGQPLDLPAFKQPDFAEQIVTTKVALKANNEKNELWPFAAFQFKENCGLYFILYLKEASLKKEFEPILASLKYSGIGGKRSAGYGGFNLELLNCPENFKKLLDNDKSQTFMSLSTFSPTKDEMEHILEEKNKSYALVRREGFVYSNTYSDTARKRRKIAMFAKGSCFERKYQGTIQNLAEEGIGKHPVYRYGKAMMVGLNV